MMAAAPCALAELLPTATTPVEAILHIGRPQPGVLEACLASPARRLVFAVPDPASASPLAPHVAGEGRVTVIVGAVTPRPPPLSLIRYDFADLDSLAEPAELATFFPGAREIGRSPVAARSPVDVVADLALGAEETAWLIVDLPGEEHRLLSALAEAGELVRFERLLIRGQAEPLYAEAPQVDAVAALCAEAGYLTPPVHGGADPLRPWLRLRRDPATPRPADFAALQAQIAALEAARSTAQTEIASLVAERDAAGAARDAMVAARDAAMAELVAARAAAQAAMSDRDRAQAAEAAARSAQAAADQAAARQVAAAARAHADGAAALARAQADRAAAQAESAAQAEARAAATRDRDAARAEATVQAQAAAEARAEVDRLRAARDALAARHAAAEEAAAGHARALEQSRQDLRRVEGQVSVIADLFLKQPAP